MIISIILIKLDFDENEKKIFLGLACTVIYLEYRYQNTVNPTISCIITPEEVAKH